MHKVYDIIIVGGGLAGSALACALAPLSLRIAIIEAKPTTHTGPDPDGRSLTLSASSKNIFSGMDLWSLLKSTATPIKTIHVSDRGHFGNVLLNAEKLDLEAIGYVIPMQHLLSVLEQQAATHADLIQPAQVKAMAYHQSTWQVTINHLSQEYKITAPLLVAADGINSIIRQQHNITVTKRDYQQTAIVSQVTVSQPQAFSAFERFTASGPIALLPRGGEHYGLVFTVPQEQTADWLALPDQAFINALQQRFGWRLGQFQAIAKRHAYPLSLVYAEQQTQPGLVLLGNAAHTLHPIAGQGFNLALRDIAHLADRLAQAVKNQQPLGNNEMLAHYEQQRLAEQKRMIRFTDGLTRWFCSKRWHAILSRQLGMLVMDQSTFLQQRLTKHLLGKNGYNSRLACGLKLVDG
jgi:2-octaprenyl-6-methoxyphenol hydroxylase